MDVSTEELVSQLKDWHISITPQRLEIFRTILNRYDHPSAENIFREVRHYLPMISFNTVYKTLETFCQLGIITKINPLHEVARYDGNVKPHAHFICTRCQRIENVEWEWPQNFPLPSNMNSSFKVETVSVQFFGCCHQCQTGATTSDKDH